MFLTNARIGIQSVVSWQGKNLAAGGMTEELKKAFWAS
jgi:hypothetical protein